MPPPVEVAKPKGRRVTVLAILFSVLASCSSTTQQIEQPAKSAEQDKEALPGYAGLREKWIGDLDGMVKRGYIRVLVVQSKTFYFLDGAQQRGITYEVMREFERFLNEKLGRRKQKIHVVLIPVRRDELIPSVAEGTADIASANLTVTPERQKWVDFSDAGIKNVKEVIVTGASGPQLASLDDLSGREVHVRESSSYYESLTRLDDGFRRAGKPQVKVKLADENLEDEDLLEMVNAGLITATVVDSHKADFWAQIFDNVTVHHDVAVREEGTIAWALRKNSPGLLKVVNEFVKSHRSGTLFGNVLLKRYLRSTKWVKNPHTEQEMRKFEATVDLFRKYSDQYQFDWLLIMAQAYQESGLDQSTRSPVGAVGVMQLMPTTAAGSPINIPEIHKIENNVHAGVKYLRHIVDHYFEDEAIDELNRTLFAFASYNAGPNRIQRLRRNAANEGFDPNQWFKNVELIVARKVGREPVQYVSNVYKYYIAYKLITERQRARAGVGNNRTR